MRRVLVIISCIFFYGCFEREVASPENDSESIKITNVTEFKRNIQKNLSRIKSRITSIFKSNNKKKEFNSIVDQITESENEADAERILSLRLEELKSELDRLSMSEYENEDKRIYMPTLLNKLESEIKKSGIDKQMRDQMFKEIQKLREKNDRSVFKFKDLLKIDLMHGIGGMLVLVVFIMSLLSL